MLNQDYKEMLSTLLEEKVKFLIVLSKSDLIKNKSLTGRAKDLLDAETLKDTDLNL